jgi:hypothetical protein
LKTVCCADTPVQRNSKNKLSFALAPSSLVFVLTTALLLIEHSNFSRGSRMIASPRPLIFAATCVGFDPQQVADDVTVTAIFA